MFSQEMLVYRDKYFVKGNRYRNYSLKMKASQGGRPLCTVPNGKRRRESRNIKNVNPVGNWFLCIVNKKFLIRQPQKYHFHILACLDCCLSWMHWNLVTSNIFGFFLGFWTFNEWIWILITFFSKQGHHHQPLLDWGQTAWQGTCGLSVRSRNHLLERPHRQVPPSVGRWQGSTGNRELWFV